MTVSLKQKTAAQVGEAPSQSSDPATHSAEPHDETESLIQYLLEEIRFLES
jgi:hypothetical protein